LQVHATMGGPRIPHGRISTVSFQVKPKVTGNVALSGETRLAATAPSSGMVGTGVQQKAVTSSSVPQIVGSGCAQGALGLITPTHCVVKREGKPKRVATQPKSASASRGRQRKTVQPVMDQQTYRCKLWSVLARLSAQTRAARRQAEKCPPTKLWISATVPELKEHLHACRQLAMSHKFVNRRERNRARHLVSQILPPAFRRHTLYKKDSLLQLSFASRALELPSESALNEALIQFVERRRPPANAGNLDPPCDWIAMGYVSQTHEPTQKERPQPYGWLAGPAAAGNVSRREGGKAKILSTVVGAHVPKQSLDSFYQRSPDELRKEVLKQLPSLEVALKIRPRPTYPGIARLVAIPEPGGKSRVATIHTLTDGYRAEQVGALLRLEMRSIPCLRNSLTGDPDLIKVKPNPYVNPRYPLPEKRRMPHLDLDALYSFSADLKAATDTIRMDVIELFMTRRGFTRDACSARTIKLMGVHYPVGRGTDLGKGASWPTLSLLHAYACRELGISWEAFVIKGDDLGGLLTGRQIELYLEWIPRLTGMEVNLTKTFVSDRTLLYCERAYALRVTAEGYEYRRKSYSLSTKLMLTQITKIDESGEPAAFSVGSALRREILREGRRRVTILVNASPILAKLLHRFGRWCYVPSPLGGLGLPTPTRNCGVPQLVSAFCRAVMNGGITPPMMTRPTPKNKTGTTIESLCKVYLAQSLKRVRAFRHEPDHPNFGRWGELMEIYDRAKGVAKFLEMQSKTLASERESATASLSFLTAVQGFTHGVSDEHSLFYYLRQCRRLAEKLGQGRLKGWTFKDLDTTVENSLWVPKAPEAKLPLTKVVAAKPGTRNAEILRSIPVKQPLDPPVPRQHTRKGSF
jgi:hypothetical protein